MAAPSAIRQPPPEAAPELPPVGFPVEGLGGLDSDSKNELIRVEFPDGSVSINLSPMQSANPEDASKHDENLALHMDAMELATVADQLLRLIEQDDRNQSERLTDIAKGLDLLGLKYEEPRTEPSEEGMSVVRHPGLLEAVLQFQANCRGELLPSSGPVKARNDGGETQASDSIANALEQDFNHYLTVGAPEYYPDTDRMFFSLGFGGEAYKKVYNDPLKRRPVSLTVDRKDLILSDGSVALEACPRVTHRIRMAPSQVMRMQIVGAWRDTSLSLGVIGEGTPVEQKLESIAGVTTSMTADPTEVERTIFESYCELDLKGFEHKDKSGKATGLPLPYRVTIDKDSREVLEIRRWWRDDDELCLRKEVFVEYVFVPGPGGLNIGLFHIMGNSTRALTAAWRIALDNGMLGNFPGGLIARQAGRQQTTNIRVSPGGLAPVDTGDMSIKDAVMPLPYRDVTPGFFQLVQMISAENEKVGGTANMAVGEGRQDAPVGTTIAMIEQATKILGAVHKRMHTAQLKEFVMLKELFREDPAAFWRGNKQPAMPKDEAALVAALNDDNIVPAADPNTASQVMRIQKAIAIKTLAASNAPAYDMAAVDRRILNMIGVEDIDELFAKGPPQGDPNAAAQTQAKTMDSQAKLIGAQAKMAQVKVQALDAASDAQNRAADRESKERQAVMSLAKTEALHPEAVPAVRELAESPLFPGTPTGDQGPI